MYDVLNSFAYNEFIKEKRKNMKISTQNLSYKVYLSVGTINNIENSLDILNNNNLGYLLNYYDYEKNFLINFDKQIAYLFQNFFDNIILINDKEVDSFYLRIEKICDKSTSVLYTPLALCKFILSMYYAKNIEKENIEFLERHIHYLSEKYQSLANMYLGEYYSQLLDVPTSKSYHDKALFNISKDNSYEAMYHYFLSNFYTRQNDIFNSYIHHKKAIEFFAKSRNHRRILNIDIKIGTQYIYIGNYNKALHSYNIALSQAKENDYLFESYVILHNKAFVYMLQNKYDKAVECYNLIPKKELTQKNCHAYMISLVNINQIYQADELCNLGKSLGDNSYFLSFFEAYSDYISNRDLNNLTKKIEKILKEYKKSISFLELQFIHTLLSYLYKQIGRYKKSTDHLEKYIDLLTNNN